MAELAEKKDTELFGIMRRLPEIIISVIDDVSEKGGLEIYFSHSFVRLMMTETDVVPVGSLAMNELLELSHDESIVSLFQFMEERFEITPDQFIWGCLALPKQSSNYDVIGYARVEGVLWTLIKHVSGLEWYFEAKSPHELRVARDPGTRIFSHAF